MRSPASSFGVIFAALAAFASVSSPTPAVAQPTTAAARCRVDRDACLREALPTLGRALPEVGRSPAAALAALRASGSPAARAWAAYLAHHAGDDVGAEAILAALARDGEAPTVDNGGDGDVADRALRLAREHADLLSGEAPDFIGLLPCAIFAWDPGAAARAFGPTHGSTRDAIVAPFKRRCVTEALGAALPPAAGARVEAASEAVTRALFRQWPRPADGTMWTAVAISAQEALRDPLLAVDGASVGAQDAATLALVARLTVDDPRSLARLGAYRRAAQGQVGALANGICAVSRERGRPLTAGQCERRAYAATLTAFTVWVGAMHGL
jgi:hypothetical protein